MKDREEKELLKENIFLKDKVGELNRIVEEIKERENFYRNLIEISPFAILIHWEGKIQFANKSAKRLLELKEDEDLTGKDIFEIITPEFRKAFMDRIKEILEKKEEKAPLELEISTGGGKTKGVEVFDGYIEFKGRPSVLTFILDITEEKLKEKKFKRFLNNIFDGVYESTPDGRLLMVNPALVKMLGYDSEEELLSKSIKELYYNPEDRDLLVKKIEEDGEIRNYEIKLKRKDGMEIYVIDNSRGIRDSKGKIISFEGTLTDITKRKIEEEELKMNYERLKKIVESVINAMVKMVEKKDPYTAGHERHVAKLATAIAKELGFSEEKVEEIKMTALIHDIGKMFIPSEILVKPGKLTEEEFAFIKLHAYHGYEILKTIDFPWNVATVVLQHHERYDGSGYPQRLKGEEILMEARILSVADVVEAITFHRPYRPGHGVEKAIQEISRYKGILYDPDVVDACLKIFKEKGFKFENSNN